MLPFPFFLVSFAVTFLLCPLVRRLAFLVGAVDLPGGRHLHTFPTPRLGGLAVAVALAVSLPLSNVDSDLCRSLLRGGLVIVCLGIRDDTKGVTPLCKLMWQLTASLLAVWYGVPFTGLGHLSVPVTLLWLLLLTNAFNLIDGLDGLCAGCGGIAALLLSLFALVTGQRSVAAVAFPLFGACLGFLPHNMRQKKLFLGDTGAQLIGFTVGLLTIPLINGGEAIPVLLTLLYPLIETATTVLRRLKNKKSPFRADRGHFHHRLIDKGISPLRTVWILLCPTMLWGAVGVLFAVSITAAVIVMLLSLFTTVLLERTEQLAVTRQ